MAIEITLTHDNGKDRARCSSFVQATDKLEEWAVVSRNRPRGAKVAYVLVDVRRGLFFRSSLELAGTGPDRVDLAQTLIRYLSWVCGDARPARRTEEQYRNDIAQFSAAMVSRARAYLEAVTDIVDEEQSYIVPEEPAAAPAG